MNDLILIAICGAPFTIFFILGFMFGKMAERQKNITHLIDTRRGLAHHRVKIPIDCPDRKYKIFSNK